MTVTVQVREERHGDVSVARVVGEVDAANVGELGLRLRRLLSNRSTRLVVDLSDTGYLDSAGINLLFTLGDELRARQQTLRLVVADGSPIRRMLSITSVDRTFPLHADLADAIAAP